MAAAEPAEENNVVVKDLDYWQAQVDANNVKIMDHPLKSNNGSYSFLVQNSDIC